MCTWFHRSFATHSRDGAVPPRLLRQGGYVRPDRL